ncbi:MAG: ribosome biogenesis GTPase Der [Desulfobacteraceae bacterium]|nr:ribosome biogenesis GTPase Der [Desulfobacteraceae bacterium]
MAPLIVIVGRPNVGKSTLFNRLSRSRDALVDNRPGITRDRLYAPITYEGASLTLVDTGGFDDISQDPLLERVRYQVEAAIMEADGIIFMVDARQGVTPGDEEMAHILRKSQKKIFLAANKIDGPEHENSAHDFYKFGLEPVYPVSAAHGYGIRSLMRDMVRDLPISKPVEYSDGQIRVAILGRPNVGKSSLINRILGLERVVVSEHPGTTRDTVDTPFSHGGKEYLLIDTAGIRKKAKVKEKIDKFSMIKALKSLDRCHIATILLDASQGVSEQDARICGYAFEQGRGVVLAINKWDLVKGDARRQARLNNSMDRQLKFMPFAPRVNLSALTGERVMKLFGKIDPLYEQFSRAISTASINRALQEIVRRHPPPRIGRSRLKFSYATQTRTKPPTFVVFVNKPNAIHFSYERFLVNQLRSHLRLELTPIRLRFRKK